MHPEGPDEDRTVEQDDEHELTVLPDQTTDDTDVGWGDGFDDPSDDDRLLAERPPHW